MSINVRPVDPVTDLARIAELTNAVHLDLETVDLLREDLARQLDGRFMRSLVASVPDEAVAGYAVVDHVPWQPAGRFWVWVTVDQRWRGQGIGSMLFAQVLTLATEQHAAILATQVRDDQPESLAFAERRNFHVKRHIFESMKGARTIRTNNDSQNAPMLAVNRKLGYRPEPGVYRLIKKLI